MGWIRFNRTGETLGETYSLGDVNFFTDSDKFVTAGVAVAMTDAEVTAMTQAQNGAALAQQVGASNIGGGSVIRKQFTQLVLPNTALLTEQDLLNFTIPAGTVGPNDFLRFILVVSTNSNANTKTLRLKVGGVNVLNFGISSTTQHGKYLSEIANRGVLNSQVYGQAAGANYGGTTSGATGTSAIDFAQDVVVRVTGQLAVAADQINLESFILTRQ